MRILLVGLVLCLAYPTAAQGVYRAGYIVAAGDTLRGEILIATDSEAARGAQFQATGSPSERAIGPDDASAFGETSGRRYRRGLYQTSNSSDEGVSEPLLGFARVVRRGRASLLSFEPGPGPPTLYLALDDDMTRLLSTEQVDAAPITLDADQPESYRQVLSSRLGDCDASRDAIEDLTYTESSIASVVDSYNRCLDVSASLFDPVRTDRPRRPTRIAYEALLGAASSSFQRVIVPAGISDPTQSSVYLGAGAHISPGFATQSLSFPVWLEYHRSLVGTVILVDNRDLSEVQRDALLLSLGSRVTAKVSGTPFYLGFGLSTGRVLSRTLRSGIPVRDPVDEGFVTTTTDRFFTSIDGGSLGFGFRPLDGPVGIGVEIRRFGFSERTVNIPGDLAGTDRYQLNTVTVQTSYRF